MACAIIEGNLIPCRESSGGVAEIYISEVGNKVTSVSSTGITESSGIITAIAMQTGTKFWTYKMEKENATFTDVTTVSAENGSKFNKQDGTVMIKQLNSSNRNQLDLLAKNRVMVIVKDNNGVYWLLGQNNGLDIVTITAATGKAMGDLNGYTVVFSGAETTPAKAVISSLMATLTVNA